MIGFSRWFVVLAGLIVMLCLGSVYSYSVISVLLEKFFEAEPPYGYGLKVSSTEMQLPFIVFLVVFAITMPIMSKYVEKYGPRKMTMMGAVFVSLGWFLASYANSPLNLVFLYGVIGGFGVGIAYNCPIVASARWFPDKRGLAVGLTVLGFGLSAAFISPIIDFLATNFGIPMMFQILGITFLILMFIFSTFLHFPPRGWKPDSWNPMEVKGRRNFELSFSEAVRTRSFYTLWICYTIGTLAGLLAIGISKPVGLEVAANARLNGEKASTLMTGLMVPFALCNGLGRPLFGWLTDKLTPRKVTMLSFTLIIFASILMYTNPASIQVYILSFAILWLNLGGWLAMAPAITAQFFGTKDYANIYGAVYTAYGVGAIIGNILAGQVKDNFGTYIDVFPVVAALALIGLIVSIILRAPIREQ